MTVAEALTELATAPVTVSADHRRKIVACVKDWVAAYVVGLSMGDRQSVSAALAAEGCVGEDGFPRPGQPMSLAEKAFWLGIIGHLANFNDAEFVGNTSPTSALLPALLPVAAARRAHMHTLVDALAVGYGVIHYLGRVMNPDHFERGWNPTSTIGCVATTAAVARCLGLDSIKARAAIEIATGQMSGFKAGNGSIAKPVNAGRAAWSAVRSALLAAHDAPAGTDAFTGPLGALRMFGASNNKAVHLADMARGVEAVTFKAFPCFFGAQQPVTLGQRLSRDIDTNLVEEVRIVTSPYTHKSMSSRAPQTWAEGQFSCTHCVAVALIDGEHAAVTLTEASLLRPEVRGLEARTFIEANEGFLKFEASLSLLLPGNRRTEARNVLDLASLSLPSLPDGKLDIVAESHLTDADRVSISSVFESADLCVTDLLARLLALRPKYFDRYTSVP
jgi:2-methylcitrate dehydratase PrpD